MTLAEFTADIKAKPCRAALGREKWLEQVLVHRSFQRRAFIPYLQPGLLLRVDARQQLQRIFMAALAVARGIVQQIDDDAAQVFAVKRNMHVRAVRLEAALLHGGVLRTPFVPDVLQLCIQWQQACLTV